MLGRFRGQERLKVLLRIYSQLLIVIRVGDTGLFLALCGLKWESPQVDSNGLHMPMSILVEDPKRFEALRYASPHPGPPTDW